MPHFRVDDGLHSHPKAMGAGDEAMGLWVRAGAYCMHYLTDGFVPDWWVRAQSKGLAKAKKLVAAGLWFPAKRPGQEGWAFHEWRQDSKAKIEIDREKARVRKASSRGESQGESQCDSGETPGYIPTTHNPEVTNVTPLESARAKKTAIILTDDWHPAESTAEWVRANYPEFDLNDQVGAFIDFYLAKGQSTGRDWDRSFQGWMRKARQFGTNRAAPRNGSTVDDKVNGYLNREIRVPQEQGELL